jgi:AcrR family transcriptional regulator
VSGEAPAGRRVGRPLDRSSDASILATMLDLVAERDHERVTLDELAARTGRAKTTLYRRWATKEDLLLAAIRSMGRPPEADEPPDTGSLRSDLLAVLGSPWLGGPDRRMAVFAGLLTATRGSERLASVIRSEITEPYVEAYASLLRRAIERGEIPDAVARSVDVLSEVIPALTTHRLTAGTEPVGWDFIVSVVDDVVLAAVRASR